MNILYSLNQNKQIELSRCVKKIFFVNVSEES